MLIKRLKTIAVLKKVINKKQSNGSRIEEYQEIDSYKVQKQELDDEISASIYGANIVNMLRIKSPQSKLENILIKKVNNTTDNISKYRIFINDKKYKIKVVNSKGIDIELI